MEDVIKKVEHIELAVGGSINLAAKYPVNRIWFKEIDFVSPLEDSKPEKYVFKRAGQIVATLKVKDLSENDKERIEKEREYLRKKVVKNDKRNN